MMSNYISKPNQVFVLPNYIVCLFFWQNVTKLHVDNKGPLWVSLCTMNER